jgi:hypothetical protein
MFTLNIREVPGTPHDVPTLFGNHCMCAVPNSIKYEYNMTDLPVHSK